jgi:mannitol-1-phosphate/altronate dehydrogenase
VQVLNTVIGKMSGVISEGAASRSARAASAWRIAAPGAPARGATIARLGLAPLTPRLQRAVLVEEFNRILISRVELPGCKRGIEVFVEKPALLPFEEAKLYGHNAIHAMIAYLAELKGLETIAEAGGDRWIMGRARKAFLCESGRALIKRHKDLNDPLFTEEGYQRYADDLLARMINPYLNDLVVRVGRDHVRKLGYDDRLFGTMRLALDCGLRPVNLALGAAAGVVSLIRRRSESSAALPELPGGAGAANRSARAGAAPAGRALTKEALSGLLRALWKDKTNRQAEELVRLTWEGLEALRQSGMIR